MAEEKRSRNRASPKKGNRNLRRRIAALNKEIESHAQTLNRQHWNDICDRLDGQLSSVTTWKLLRHLLDPDNTKAETRRQMQRLTHNFQGSEEDMINQIKDRYIGETNTETLPDYSGENNEELDQPITLREVQAALNRLSGKTAAGQMGSPIRCFETSMTTPSSN